MEQYIAFISYRHKELDSAIAARLHSLIERYPIPKAISQKYGKKRMGRVFRDKEELPLSSDLSKSITDALDRSEHLIIVCSPDTPGSVWVQKEIEYFLRTHSFEKILIVLAAGEPETSFPEALIRNEPKIHNQVSARPIQNNMEPLAADVRSESIRKSLRLLKRESTRIAAALLSCPYDELQQRFRKRAVRRASVFFAAIMLSVLFYAGTLLKKNAEIDNANQNLIVSNLKIQQVNADLEASIEGMQVNQSRYLSEISTNLLKEGERIMAIQVAMEALPQNDNRPLVPEAEYALSEALYAYRSDQSTLLPYKEVDINYSGRIVDSVLNQDASVYVCLFDNNRLFAIDTNAGKELWKYELPGACSKSQIFVNDRINAVVVTCSQGITYIDVSTGKLLREMKFSNSNEVYVSVGAVAATPVESNLVLPVMVLNGDDKETGKYAMLTIDLERGVITNKHAMPELKAIDWGWSEPAISVDGKFYMCQYMEAGTFEPVILQYNVHNQSHEWFTPAFISSSTNIVYTYSPDSKSILIMSYDGFDGEVKEISQQPQITVARIMNNAGFPTVWSQKFRVPITSMDIGNVVRITYNSNPINIEDSFVVTSIHRTINIFSYQDGEILANRSLTSSARQIFLGPEFKTLWYVQSNGDVDALSPHNNFMNADHPSLLDVWTLGYSPEKNSISFRKGILVARKQSTAKLVIHKFCYDEHGEVIGSGLDSFDNRAWLVNNGDLLLVLSGSYEGQTLNILNTRDKSFRRIHLGKGYDTKEVTSFITSGTETLAVMNTQGEIAFALNTNTMEDVVLTKDIESLLLRSADLHWATNNALVAPVADKSIGLVGFRYATQYGTFVLKYKDGEMSFEHADSGELLARHQVGINAQIENWYVYPSQNIGIVDFGSSAFVLDLSTYQPRLQIRGFLMYDERNKMVYLRNAIDKELVAYPYYDIEKLYDWASQLMDGDILTETMKRQYFIE